MTEQPKKLVILMEDEDNIARLITNHLNMGGFCVRRPVRAPDLIAEAEKQHPALFVLGSHAAGDGWISSCAAQ